MEKFLIEENKTIYEAMKKIDMNQRRILFLHRDRKLLAAITDGDIRRWMLGAGDLNLPVKCAANYDPVFVKEEQADLSNYFMKKYGITAIPIVDNNDIIKDIVFESELPIKKKKFEESVPVVIMAGGVGQRLYPYTNILPKPLIPIGEYPIVEHIINSFCEYGCKDYYMVVNYKRNMIKAYFDDQEKKYFLDYIVEEKKMGTGGGISLLKGKIKSTFILTNCDILIDDDLTKAYKQHREKGNIITVICSMKNFVIPYGVVKVGAEGNIESMSEKPKMSFLTNTGCYIVEPRVVDELECNEAIDFPAIIERYRVHGEKIGVYPISEEAWLDMGQLDELEKMKKRLGY